MVVISKWIKLFLAFSVIGFFVFGLYLAVTPPPLEEIRQQRLENFTKELESTYGFTVTEKPNPPLGTGGWVTRNFFDGFRNFADVAQTNSITEIFVDEHFFWFQVPVGGEILNLYRWWEPIE